MVTVVIKVERLVFSKVRDDLMNKVELHIISENPATGTFEGLVRATQLEKINGTFIPGVRGVEASKRFRYPD